jgi:hypothetical protein
MRARLLWMMAVLPLACTRDNPAFDPDGETETDQLPTTDTLDSTDAGESSDEGSGLVCELGPGPGLDIVVPQPCGETNVDTDAYEHWMLVDEAAGSTWTVQYCNDEACADCEAIMSGLTVAPLPVADIAPPGACLWVGGRRLGTMDDCNYQTLVVYDLSSQLPNVPVLVARSTLDKGLVGLDNTELQGFAPQTVEVESCPCEDYPDACCTDAEAPSLHAFEVGLPAPVPVGQTAMLSFAVGEFEFWALDAFDPGDCDRPLHTAWALTR